MKKLTIVDRILYLINSLFILFIILSYISPLINPNLFWPISFLGLTYPLFLIIIFLFLFYWIIRLKRPLWANLIVIAVGISHVSSHIGTKKVEKNFSKKELLILSYNTRMLNKYEWIKEKNIDEKISSYLKNVNPDIACFQEFDNEKVKVLGYKHNHSKDNFLIVSKFPILKKHSTKDFDNNTVCITADILIYDDTISVTNMHLASNWFDQSEYEMINSMKINRKGFFDIFHKLKNSFELRADQVQIINGYLKNIKFKKIVCGDLNDTPLSYSYQKIRGNMKDSFVEAGKGIGKSYSNIPFLRIDYIFIENELTPTEYRHDYVNYSDHLPIMSKIAF